MVIRVTGQFSELIFHKLIILTNMYGYRSTFETINYTQHYKTNSKEQKYIQEVYK